MISVIVPVYNTADYLRRCIDSILCSSYEDFELILVDDGSVDYSASICRKYCEQDCRVKYFRQGHKGVSAARNKGIEESEGTWVLFVDSDDFISSDFLEAAAQEEFQKQELLLFDFMRTRNGQRIGGSRAGAGRNVCCHYEGKDRLHLIRCLLDMKPLQKKANANLASPWAKAYKKSVIEQHHIRFKENLTVYEDRLFNVEYFLVCRSYIYIQKQVYFAEVRADSAMRGFFPNYLQNDLRYQERLCSLLKRYRILSAVKTAYYNSVQSNMTDILVRGIFHPASTRTYRESCMQCDRMQKVKIYRKAVTYRKQAGNLPRRLLLHFYCRRRYHMVKLICRTSYRILKIAGWL